jgi:hypothetical protein
VNVSHAAARGGAPAKERQEHKPSPQTTRLAFLTFFGRGMSAGKAGRRATRCSRRRCPLSLAKPRFAGSAGFAFFLARSQRDSVLRALRVLR